MNIKVEVPSRPITEIALAEKILAWAHPMRAGVVEAALAATREYNMERERHSQTLKQRMELQLEIAGLVQWECESCGARFKEYVRSVEIDGVKRCSNCVIIEAQKNRISGLLDENARLVLAAKGVQDETR